MVKFKVPYDPEKVAALTGWVTKEGLYPGPIDFPALGTMVFAGAKLVYKAKEAKALFG